MAYTPVFPVKDKHTVRNTVMKVMACTNIHVLLVVFVNIKKYLSYALNRLTGEIN